MMGHRQIEQAVLFYEFSLEKHIPADHLMRSMVRFVDLREIRRALAPFYSSIGRPSIDPELMIRMLLIGHCFGIRSERRPCDEVHLNFGLPVVLPARSERRGAGSLDVFQVGISEADLRIVLIKNVFPNEDHAVLAARVDGEWLILDSRTLTLVRDSDLTRATPIFVLDNVGAWRVLPGGRTRRDGP